MSEDRTVLPVSSDIKLWVERKIRDAQAGDVAEFRALEARVVSLERNDATQDDKLRTLFDLQNTAERPAISEHDNPLTKAKVGLYTAATGAVGAVGYGIMEWLK